MVILHAICVPMLRSERVFNPMCDSLPESIFGTQTLAPNASAVKTPISLIQKEKICVLSVHQRPTKGDNRVLHIR
jgi:hypothetical protein